MGEDKFQNGIMDSLDGDSGFLVEDKAPVIIKVVGVGGGGDNAVNHMYQQNISGVSFVVANTDQQALKDSPVPNRLLLGPTVCEGLGAGNIPDVARKAAEESAEDIRALFEDETKMVFITAGMGGGTGTGAAPVVARIAREKGILTIGIVTIPFLFEGQRKIMKALEGADEMGKYVDAMLIINNQRLTEIYPDLDLVNAFGKADDTLSIAARSISELITTSGQINLDFRDVNTTLREGGVAIISTGYGEGQKRVTKAIEDALESPLLKNRDVYGSKRVLINVYFNPNSQKPFKMEEMGEIEDFMANCSPEIDVITGTAFDQTLEDKVKVTILASGFEVSLKDESPVVKKTVARRDTQEQAQTAEERLKAEYGEAVDKQAALRAKARYVILRPEDMENDDILDMLWNTPVSERKPEFLPSIKALQTAAQQPKVPVYEEPKKGKQGIINFGSNG